jgi:acetyltransferase-like isoleucine patch superfamily enzyme
MLVVIIALMPTNVVRVSLYRWLLGYDIDWSSRVGWLSLLDIRKCQLRSASIGCFNQIRCHRLDMAPGAGIGRLNRFKCLHTIRLGDRSTVVARNRFMGPRPGLTPYEEYAGITIGCDSVIVSEHYFDLSDSITLGDDVTIGGIGAQFWTHGFDLNHVKIQSPIEIGSHVYLGSRCLCLPGVHIADHVLIGAGTVVAKSIGAPGAYVSSALIRVGEAPDYAADSRVVEHRGARFLRRERKDRA